MTRFTYYFRFHQEFPIWWNLQSFWTLWANFFYTTAASKETVSCFSCVEFSQLGQICIGGYCTKGFHFKLKGNSSFVVSWRKINSLKGNKVCNCDWRCKWDKFSRIFHSKLRRKFDLNKINGFLRCENFSKIVIEFSARKTRSCIRRIYKFIEKFAKRHIYFCKYDVDTITNSIFQQSNEVRAVWESHIAPRCIIPMRFHSKSKIIKEKQRCVVQRVI